MDIVIREEVNEDYANTEDVVKNAFLNEEHSDKQEHILVKRIWESDAFIPELSLVATNQADEVIGHILLSEIDIVNDHKSVKSLALAPVSVLPEYQKQGIGSQLIRAALKKAKEIGYHSVIVLGHEGYYPKFGFKPAHSWNIYAPFDVPEEAFMAIELTGNALDDVEGLVRYSGAFSE